MKFKKAVVLMLISALLLGGFGQTPTVSKAVTTNVRLGEDTQAYYTVIPGETTHFKIPVEAASYNITTPDISVSSDSAFITSSSSVTLSKDNSISEITMIKKDEITYIEFDVTIKETTSIGTYPIDITFNYNHYTTVDSEVVTTPVEETLSINTKVLVEKEPAQLTLKNVVYNLSDVIVDGNFTLNFDVENEGELEAYNIYLSAVSSDGSIVASYTGDSVKIGDLSSGETQALTIPLTVLPTAEAGFKTIVFKFTYKNSDGVSQTSERSVYVTVGTTENVASDAANLVLQAVEFNTSAVAGENVDLSISIKNTGLKSAKEISVMATEGVGVANGIIPLSKTEKVSAKDLVAGEKTEVSIPFMIAKDAAAGLREITLKATYTDSDKVLKTAEITVYLTITKQEEADEDKTETEVIIENVSQSPSMPKPGDTLSVSFNMINNGNKDITGVKIAGTGLSNASFEPINSEPYQVIGTIAAGESKAVTLNFTVGKSIPTGLNALNLAYSYKDADGNSHDETASIYILNVQNDAVVVDTTKPKLIISDYKTNEDQLTAGSTFDFIFTIKNTNTTKAAKNIKVTISQTDNVFSASQGSNSFYISSIAAGEESENTMNLKVRSDATTGTYDLTILVEYEYDNMSQSDQENGGVSEHNSIKLTAVENARPVVQNISVYDAYTYGSPVVNSNCALTFEFYNMGRSALNNVYATVEGDFSLTTGTMYYIGTVAAGSAEYAELEAMPTIEGDAACNIVIHFEDSNGNEVTKTTEYTTYVSPATSWDDGSNGGYPDDGGYIDPGTVVTAKEPILPVWLFIAVEAAAFVIFIFVARGIMLTVYKSKMRKKMEKEEKDA